MSSQYQTLAQGQTAAQRYGKFGVSGHRVVANPEALFGMIIGETGSCKTSLFADHPGALILNCDKHSVPRTDPPTLAQFFPIKDKDGKLLGLKGPLKTLQWEDILAVSNEVIVAHDNGQPHPSTIVLDTVSSSVELCCDAYARSKGKLAFSEFTGKLGEAAWGHVYDAYMPWINKFVSRGIGFYLIGHTNTHVKEVNDKATEINVLSFSDTLYDKRFKPALEFVAMIQMENYEEEVEVEAQTPTGTTYKKKVRERGRRPVLVTSGTKYDRYLRSPDGRLSQPLLLPRNGAWQVFAEAYSSSKPERATSA